jgi:hypothetical protein
MMMPNNVKLFVWAFLVSGMMFDGINAAQPPAPAQQPQIPAAGIIDRRPNALNVRELLALGNVQWNRKIQGIFAALFLQDLRNKLPHDHQLIGTIDGEMRKLFDGESSTGRAIAIGLGGADIKDEHITNKMEGLGLGLSMLAAKAFSDAMREPVTNALSRAFTGPLDFIIDAVAGLFNFMNEELFHDGKSPFKVKQLQGWQKLVWVCLDDIKQLLDKNSMASMRGLDKTLREASSEQDDGTSIVWKGLILGYARQLDYFVTQIDKHAGYYHEGDTVFYAQEIKRRLQEIREILVRCASPKDLDISLDSNKMLIVAWQKNIDNLFVRLIESIDRQKGAVSPAVGSSQGKNRDYLRDYSNNRNDDDVAPHSFRGWN